MNVTNATPVFFSKSYLILPILIISFLVLMMVRQGGEIEVVAPAFFYCIGGFTLFFYFKISGYNKIIIGVFVIYYLITLHLPYLFIILRYSGSQIEEFISLRNIDYVDILRASIYVMVFDFLLILLLFMMGGGKRKARFQFKYILYESDKKILLFLLFVASVIAKLYLMHVGVWFFYEMNNIDVSGDRFLSIAYLLEKLDFIILIYIAYKGKLENKSKFEVVLFILVTCVSMFFAFLSTSKARMLIILLPSFVLLKFMNNKKTMLFWGGVIALCIVPFFKYMTVLRHVGGDVAQVEMIEDDSVSILDNKLLVRLDYQTVLSKVLATYPSLPDGFNSSYSDNFIGLIPRMIWPGKPIIGLDMNRIGYQIGMLSYRDNVTSIGITPIGVSYYFFGYVGLIFIAFFISSLIMFFSAFLNTESWMGFFLSLMISMELARNGTYVNIIPSLLQIIIFFTILGLLLNNKRLMRDR